MTTSTNYENLCLPELELFSFDGPESHRIFGQKPFDLVNPRFRWWEISCPKKLLFTAGSLSTLFVVHIPCNAGVHGRGSRFLHLVEFKEPVGSHEISDVCTYGSVGWPGSACSYKYFADLVKRANALREVYTPLYDTFKVAPPKKRSVKSAPLEVDLTEEQSFVPIESEFEPTKKKPRVSFVAGTPETEMPLADVVPEIQLAQEDPELPSDDDVSHVTTCADLNETFDFEAD